VLLKLTANLLTLCNALYVGLLTCVYDSNNDSHLQKWVFHLEIEGRFSSTVCCSMVFLAKKRVISSGVTVTLIKCPLSLLLPDKCVAAYTCWSTIDVTVPRNIVD
jgi:hypothetical protein